MTRPVCITGGWTAGLVLFGLLSAGMMLLPGGLELCIIPVAGKKPLLTVPLDPDERFTLYYIHSVERTPIWEEHAMDAAGRLYIEEERYEKSGAGMGHLPGIGRMVQKGKYEAITDMHRPTGDFILRVGSPDIHHTLIWRDRHFTLSETIPHQAVRFSGRPIRLVYRWWRYPGHWYATLDPNRQSEF